LKIKEGEEKKGKEKKRKSLFLELINNQVYCLASKS
jgi:hypothetical protein